MKNMPLTNSLRIRFTKTYRLWNLVLTQYSKISTAIDLLQGWIHRKLNQNSVLFCGN